MLLVLIVPLIIEQALSIFVGLVDGVMVSAVGEAAISGVSLVDMINNVINKLFAALATGGAVVASQLLGAGRRDDACRVSNQLVMVVLWASAVSIHLHANSAAVCKSHCNETLKL